MSAAEKLRDVAFRMRACAMCNHAQEVEAIAATLESKTCELTPYGMMDGQLWLACSNCRGYVSAYYDPPRYCPHCGAKVVER